MYKLICISIMVISLQGCGGKSSSIISSGATIASGGSVSKTILTAGTSFYIEKSTGKSAFQHVADNTIEAEKRNCEIDHSAEINKIFFVTLDQFDCVIK